MESKKRGPQIPEIHLEQVRELAEIGCTQSEAAAVIGIARRTFEDHLGRDPILRQVWDAGQDVLRVSVRRMQLAMLRKGNATMAVWLGKQLLGQRDKVDISDSTPQFDFDRLNAEERSAFERIVAKLSGDPIPSEPSPRPSAIQ